MGKFATYLKRGSAAGRYSLAPPEDAAWAIGTVTTTSIQGTLLGSFPPNATTFILRAIKDSDGSVAGTANSSGSSATVTGLTTGTLYRMQIAWRGGSPATQMSEYSAVKLQATA